MPSVSPQATEEKGNEYDEKGASDNDTDWKQGR